MTPIDSEILPHEQQASTLRPTPSCPHRKQGARLPHLFDIQMLKRLTR